MAFPRFPASVGRIRTQVVSTWSAALDGPYGRTARRWAAPAVRVLGPVTPLGWSVVAAAFLSWVVWLSTGWAEAGAMCMAGFVLVFLSVAWSLLQGGMEVSLSLSPTRVTAGESAGGEVVLRRVGRRRRLPAVVELPVGMGRGRFYVGGSVGSVQVEQYSVFTEKRGVVRVGPARSISGDPFGLVRREQTWTGICELFVHPHTVHLPALDAGMIRDLEGRSTTDPSPSDLDFHTVRPYVPADDRRHVHWKATARSGSVGPSETQSLLVKQYYDTRRSHLGLVVDVDAGHYPDPDDVEMALEAAASLAVRACRDELDVSVAAGDRLIHAAPLPVLLDGFAQVEVGSEHLSESVVRLMTAAPQMSLVVFVVGPQTDHDDLRLGVSLLPASVRPVILRVHPGHQPGLSTFPGASAMVIGRVEDLPMLVREGTL
ncbi:DUF58 domain-containing protein [Austwickia chelonae]|uniref:DUF58 domain-containing protein n=1 Tax=Austwickia chelonae TaxID=100225 RepID=UPI000E26E8B1|nr:DUF58 domain-containing protein [Austwickia chelonae]